MKEWISLNLTKAERQKVEQFFADNYYREERNIGRHWTYETIRGSIFYYNDNKIYHCDTSEKRYTNFWELINTQTSWNCFNSDNVLILNKKEFYQKHPYSGIEDIVEKARNFYEANYYINTESRSEMCRAHYMLNYLQAPFVEQLYKTCDCIFADFAIGRNQENIFKFFRSGKNMSEITRMPNWLWKMLVNYDEGVFEQFRRWYKASIKEGHPLAPHDVEMIISLYPSLGSSTLSKIRYLLKNTVDENGKPLFTLTKLINYLERVDMYQAISPIDALDILRDYVGMCKKIETVPIVDSNSLKREHDVTVRIFNQKVRTDLDEKQKKGFEQKYSKLSKYEFENDDLVVIAPKEPIDLVNEGRCNRNCVAGYIDRYASDDTEIFFIRPKKTPEKSYITIQTYNNCEEVSQAFYACNMPITKTSDRQFIDDWLKHNKQLNIQC